MAREQYCGRFAGLSIPLPQVALVLVDVWDHHYLKDTEARTERVIDENLLPLLTACRSAGLSVIHAPSPAQAMQHPNWSRRDEDQSAAPHDSWPPPEFRSKSGPYQAYRRPGEARQPELQQLSATRQLHPKIQPMAGEVVVATGSELHHHCKQQGILFLLFAGFNTNACILARLRHVRDEPPRIRSHSGATARRAWNRQNRSRP
ncbi:MAG: hypothetical protein R3C56_15210 [Pirellulaceae bacterium]